MSLSDGVDNSTLDYWIDSNVTAYRSRMEGEAPRIMTIVMFTLTVLLGVPGNGAVIWVTGFKMKRTVYTICFLNLAVADLMYCLCLSFLIICITVQNSFDVIIIYSVCGLIVLLNSFASIDLLCLISIYRCLAVTRPIWFKQNLSLAWVRATCVFVWVFAGVICLPIFIMKEFSYAVLILSALSFSLPFVIMIICYAIAGWTLHGGRFGMSRKPILLIVTAVTAFVICWFPFTLFSFIPNDIYSIGWDWYLFTHALASFNCAHNPLIYVFAGSDFRQVFKRSLFASLQLAFIEHEHENSNPISNRNV